jgi:hypothetical protein
MRSKVSRMLKKTGALLAHPKYQFYESRKTWVTALWVVREKKSTILLFSVFYIIYPKVTFG